MVPERFKPAVGFLGYIHFVDKIFVPLALAGTISRANPSRPSLPQTAPRSGRLPAMAQN